MKKTRIVSAIAMTALAACLVAAPARADEQETLDRMTRSAADFEVGVAAQRNGDLGLARKAYEDAIEKDPHFVEAMVNIARVDIERGALDEAEQWLIEARRVRADYPGIEAARGLLALRRGEPTRAARALESASEGLVDDPEVRINLGAALLQQGRAREAIDTLVLALRLDPSSSAAALNLALAYDLVDDVQRASFFYARFLEMSANDDPDRSAVVNRMAELDGTAPPATDQSRTSLPPNPVSPSVAAHGGNQR